MSVIVVFLRPLGLRLDTLLTLRDLNLIADSFVTTLRGHYHPRIQYPEPVKHNEIANETPLDELDQPTQPRAALSMPPLPHSDPPTAEVGS